MPLDWDRRSSAGTRGGARIPTVAGRKTLEITGADESGVHIRHALWRDTLPREHLERAVSSSRRTG